MWKIRVITPWINQSGTMTPDAARFLQAGESLMDVTGEPCPVNTPTPNPVVVELWCGPATVTAIENDGAYGPGAILSAEEVTDGKP